MISSEDASLIPLVSVGIPTYNRPDGLKRTLSCICGQTYRNLEIIISDNCSPDQAIMQVVEEMMQQDSRIIYVRQEKPLPIHGNFKYVLERASGEFFMWAADDDEWDEFFIEQCLKELQKHNAVSVMSHFETSFRFEGRKENGKVPPLDVDNTYAQNVSAFLSCVSPSLIYGLHRRNCIGFFLQDEFFDFYDCYFVLRLTLTGPVSVIAPVLYTAGIDAPSYQVKPVRKYRFTRLKYSPFFAYSLRAIASSSLSVFEKTMLAMKLLYVVVLFFLFHEVKGVFK